MSAHRPLKKAVHLLSKPAQQRSLQDWLVALFLGAAVIAAYWGVGACNFVTLDDPGYVVDQPMVRNGVRPAALIWAVTAVHGGNWHPLTTFSHLLDCSFFGLAPGPPHWENLAFHAANTLLVFLVFRAFGMTMWPAALVAALFGLHPLHVESVAWISERKDVLCAFFWLLGLGAYAHWVRAPSLGRYVLVFACGLLALLSKPMAVGFPITLLLLDYWPLRRWSATQWRGLIWEKLPVVGLAVVFCVIAYSVQKSVGAMWLEARFNLGQRAANAMVSYARYLGKAAWPDPLVAIYPHPGSWPWTAVLGASFLLVVVSALAIWQHQMRPWILFGWLWFLATLVPVIGIVQVGLQAMADRYTYIPLLGIFVIIAMALSEIASHRPGMRWPLILAMSTLLGLCFLATRKQVAAWRDGSSLFKHAVAVLPASIVEQLMLEDGLPGKPRPGADTLALSRRVLEVDPRNVKAHLEIARLAAADGRYEEARVLLNTARDIDPEDASVCHALGVLSVWQKRPAEAVIFLREALRLKPNLDASHRELARIFFESGNRDQARRELEAAIRCDWWNATNHEKLGLVLEAQRLIEQGRASYERALWIDPECKPAQTGLARLPPREP